MSDLNLSKSLLLLSRLSFCGLSLKSHAFWNKISKTGALTGQPSLVQVSRSGSLNSLVESSGRCRSFTSDAKRTSEVTFASNTCCVKIASRFYSWEKDVISVNLIDHGNSDTYHNYVNNSEFICNDIISRISGTRSTFPLFHTLFCLFGFFCNRFT